MQMALASGAARITLVALWDGSVQGDAPGGTSHMVGLARDAGRIHIKTIDMTELRASTG
jgi:hypothetical protein